MVGTHGGTKNGAGPRPLGGRGTPSASAKRSVEQKFRIKNGGTKIGGTKNLVGTHGRTKNGAGPQPLGGRRTPSASAKRSVEQKCGIKNWRN